jgi:hypothetical protein
VQIHTGEISTYFLTTFGRAPRETACSCEVNREANLSQALHLVNGDTLTQKIAQGKLLSGLMAEKKSPEQVIEELYVRTLCRKPTSTEVKKLAEIVRRETSDPERVKALALAQVRIDQNFRRSEERLQKLRDDRKKAGNNGKEAESLDKQIKSLEQQLDGIRQGYERNVQQIVYGDILWGLFNSTEFTFNH